MRSLLIGLLAALTGSAHAEDFAPFSNNGTLARSFLLPSLGRGRAEDGGARGALTVDFINEYHAQGTAPAESILLDGETVRLAYGLRARLADGWEWTVEAPAYIQGGGFGDDLIEGWHATFGLPNGGRERAAQDRYRYRYVRNGVTLLDAQESGTRLGDVSAGLGWQWFSLSTLRLELKWPTGDGPRLTGGNAGAALWADTEMPVDAASRWRLYWAVGASYAERGDILPGQQRSRVGFGGFGWRVRLLPRVHAFTQFYLHSALYSGSQLDPLASPGAPTAFGLHWYVSDAYVLDLAFQEDLSVSASPDFSLRLGLRARR